MKRKIVLFSVVLLLVLVGFVFRSTLFDNDKNGSSKKIAYVGRYQAVDDGAETIRNSEQFNHIHETNLEYYISEFNKRSKLNIELIKFNNFKNADSTASVYDKIVNDTSIIAIIDNTWGSELLGAVDIIRKNNLPVIAINADKNLVDYGPSTIFTGNADYGPYDVAKFLKYGIGVDSINFISEESYAIHQFYLLGFKEFGISIGSHLPLYSSKMTDDYDLDSALSKVLESGKWTVINSHNNWGTNVINRINEKFHNQKLIGLTEIISTRKIDPFQHDNELVLLTQSEDAIPNEILKDLKKYESLFPDISNGLNTSFFIKRCKDAWSILESSFNNVSDVRRRDISNSLENIISEGLNAKYDFLKFRSDGSLIRNNNFIAVNSSGSNAFTIQLNSNKKLIPNISFGIEIIDIQDIDLSSNSFSTDFYYWIKSDSSFKGIEDYITFQNIKPSESSIELITKRQFENLDYRLYKVSGKFLESYNERNFPFDEQEISIDIQILNSAERLRVSFDRESFTQNLDKLSLKGWEKKDFHVTVDNTITNKLKGNLEISDSEVNKFKNISFRFNILRSHLPGILQIILPLFFIGMIALGLLFVKSLEFSLLGEPIAAVFLTIIAFSISLSDITPSSNVLTKTDLLFILTLVTVVLCFLVVLLFNFKKGLSLNIVRYLRVFFLVSYLSIFSIIVFL